MEKYLLLIYTNFEEEEAIEFCISNFPYKTYGNVKFIMENPHNIIINFETDNKKEILSKELYSTINVPNINIYFLVNLNDLVSVYLPEPLKEFLYETDLDEVKGEAISSREMGNFLKPKKEKFKGVVDLDSILEKIKLTGINSLNKSEKKFLEKYTKKK